VDITDSSATLNELHDGDGSKPAYRTVIKTSRLSNISAFAWSPNETLVAFGHPSGKASLVQLSEHKQPSQPVEIFEIKQQRKCNSVAFSNRNWLAVALDKTRSDVCLNIYDVGSQSQISQEPIRRLCAAELVSSVKFFSSQPQELVATTQRSFIRVYDLRGTLAKYSAMNSPS